MKLPLILITACLAITGCSDIIKASKDGSISEDHTSRTTGSFVDDEIIEIKSLVNLSKSSPDLDTSHISVTSYNGVVLIAGQVPSETTRQQAEQVVRQIRKIRTVHNELVIAGPTSQLVRTNDTWLTGKIKTNMLADEQINSTRIKVVTENGVVYLMGLVTPQQAELAVNLARGSQGVQKVVKMFEYVR